MPTLQPPLHLITASGHLGHIIRDWTRHSLGARTLARRDVLPDGTLLLRTGGVWDCVVACALHCAGWLHPVVVFKNPVALWQCSRESPCDGQVDRADWTWMRRQIMLHNPGLDGLLEQVEVGTGV